MTKSSGFDTPDLSLLTDDICIDLSKLLPILVKQSFTEIPNFVSKRSTFDPKLTEILSRENLRLHLEEHQACKEYVQLLRVHFLRNHFLL